MGLIEQHHVEGLSFALARWKLAWLAPTHPVVRGSALLKTQPASAAPAVPPPPSTPDVLSNTFDRHEQGETRVEPRRKLSGVDKFLRHTRTAEALCTTCRHPKHYGHCRRPIAIKRGGFNAGMTSDDAREYKATSPGYHSATSAVIDQEGCGQPETQEPGQKSLTQKPDEASVGRLHGRPEAETPWTGPRV